MAEDLRGKSFIVVLHPQIPKSFYWLIKNRLALKLNVDWEQIGVIPGSRSLGKHVVLAGSRRRGSTRWGQCAHVIVHTILPPGRVQKWLPLNFGYHDVMRTAPPPPPPNNINTAHRGRFQVNVNPIGDSK